jgi:hypothetical protein
MKEMLCRIRIEDDMLKLIDSTNDNNWISVFIAPAIAGDLSQWLRNCELEKPTEVKFESNISFENQHGN